MTAVLLSAVGVAGGVWLLGTLIAFIVGLADYSLAAESLRRADDYLTIAEKLRVEARDELAKARRLINYPYRWPQFALAYARELQSVVDADKKVRP